VAASLAKLGEAAFCVSGHRYIKEFQTPRGFSAVRRQEHRSLFVRRRVVRQFAHSARGELLRRAGKTSDALMAFQQARELARQEPGKGFLAARIKKLTG
jgi:hypothetical protein